MKILCMVTLLLLLVVGTSFAFDVEGSSTGIFINPVYEPNGAPYGVGVGTSTFQWGDPGNFGVGASHLNFAGNNFQGFFETPFKVGTLTYFNGTNVLQTAATAVDLRVSMVLTTPTGVNQNFDFNLTLNTTPNTSGSQAGDADFVLFPSSLGNGSFVYNGDTYFLQLTEFQNASAGGYFNNEGDLIGFHVFEGYTSSADLYGKLTKKCPVVPEAGTLGLALSGLAGIFGFARRRKLV